MRAASETSRREGRDTRPSERHVRGKRVRLLLSILLMASCGDSSITGPIVTPAIDAPTVPAITGLAVSSIETAAATIVWFTDRPATGFVEYGTTTSLGSASALEAVRSTTHAVTLTGLAASTTYRVLPR